MAEKIDKLAKLFRNGGSQAVRLPKEFQFEGTEVRIFRQGQFVVLEPMPTDAGNNTNDAVAKLHAPEQD